MRPPFTSVERRVRGEVVRRVPGGVEEVVGVPCAQWEVGVVQ